MLQAADARDLKLSLLTPQERECLRLVAQQRSSKEIASELGISKASVDTYCNRARAKLGVTSRRDAAQLVLNHEIVGPAASPAAGLTPPSRSEATVPTISLLLPISSLGPMARLAIIMGGAVVLALAFGMLVSGLQSLNDVVKAASSAPAPPASSTVVVTR
ncbi:helix-turn-helix transcriptional regulator [Phenylobacterium sp. LjRoot225]|uniref:response regulator transcription factor n=1 Tax=Phenylobacterium sp. LjRoot225 TaxID=3342285 RepID=UPI003ECEC6C1